MTLREPTSVDSLSEQYATFYETHPLVYVSGEAIPLVRDNADMCHACVGGFSVNPNDPRQVTVISTLDNLLKGAASQAIQNANLIFDFDALEGLPT